MTSIVPQKPLPGIFIVEKFPEVASASSSPGSTEVLIGPARTVVRAEQGILSGSPFVSSQIAAWRFRVSINSAAPGATLSVTFGGTTILFTDAATSTAADIVNLLRTQLLGSSGTAKYVKDVYTAVDSAAGFLDVAVLASEEAIATGFFPEIAFANTGALKVTDSLGVTIVDGATHSGLLPITGEAVTSVPMPTLPANWFDIKNRRVIEEVIFSLDASRQGETFSEPERFYFDTTARMGTALTDYLGKTSQQKMFYGDFTYVADASTISATAPDAITVSRPVLGGSQRATVISVRTGVEYELRLDIDYAVPISRTAGAYIEGDVVTFINSPFMNTTWAALGTDAILVRLAYIPDRYVMPLPVLNYVPLTAKATSVLTPMPLDRFVFDPSGAGTADLDHVAPPSAARFGYTGVGNVVKQPNSLATFINLAPRLTKAVSASVVGNTNQTLNMFQFGTPNIDPASIVILRADGVALVAGSGGTDDYEYTASTNSILFRAAGVNQPTASTSNPLRLYFAYVPQVTFVGTPTLTTTVAGGLGTYFPALTHLGGGLYDASTPGFVADVVVTAPGGPYLTAPSVTIAAPTFPGGRTATAVAVLSGGAVARVVITDPGSGYIVANPVVTFGAGAAAATAVVGPVGVNQIGGVIVTDGGAGYAEGAAVTFTDTGSGAGATGIMHVDTGVITSVSMTNYGTSPYTGTIGVVFGAGGATGTAVSATGVIANVLISATIEYPLQPQVQLEFVADRSDLDGRLLSFQSQSEITASALLADVYESQTILPDITPANPALHAAAIALAAAPGFPVQVGIGDFATGRIEKIMTVLRSQPDAYWLVGITQDSTAALAFLGGHIDLMVATIAGTQVHFAPGGFRVMLTTLDQRNEAQIIPLAKDTTFGTGFLTNLLSGGIAMQANLTGATGDITKINPGQYVEFYQLDGINPLANVGSTTIARPAPHRFLITAVDVSVPATAKFTLSDASLPPSLDPSGPFDATHFLKHGAPFRIVNVREDLELGGEIRDTVQLIGGAPNGRRRWIHQPDIVVMRDLDGFTKAVPGYYRAVIVGAVRASLPPHQGLTNQPLPLLVGVHRDMGFYSDDDTINLMTDGGVDYAVQQGLDASVASLQELTANRLNQVTQSPMATQVTDYVSKRLARNVRPYIGRANIFDRTLAGIAAICDATIDGLKKETYQLIGPVILDGQINGSVRRLPITEDSSGVAVDVDLTVPQPIDKIKFTVAVDQPPA